MKQRNRANTSSLFLLELILAILFFSVASAVCVQIFVKSHLLSKDARILNFAVNEVSNAAELISSLNADQTIYYDSEFSECTEENASYQMAVTGASANSLTVTIEMQSLSDEQIIYSLEITKHQQRRADE